MPIYKHGSEYTQSTATLVVPNLVENDYLSFLGSAIHTAMAKLSSSGAAAVAALGVWVLFALLAEQGQLALAEAGYTTGGVDGVEGTVKRMVEEAIRCKPSLGPALVRLLFHDCWVNVNDY